MADDAFIRRTYKTSFFLLIFGIFVAWGLGGLAAIGGWILGGGTSIGTLRSFEWVVRRIFVPHPVDPKKNLLKFAAVKLPAVVLIVGFVVYMAKHHYLGFVAGFCFGVLLTQSVMFLKAVGTLINERLNK